MEFSLKFSPNFTAVKCLREDLISSDLKRIDFWAEKTLPILMASH